MLLDFNQSRDRSNDSNRLKFSKLNKVRRACQHYLHCLFDFSFSRFSFIVMASPPPLDLDKMNDTVVADTDAHMAPIPNSSLRPIDILKTLRLASSSSTAPPKPPATPNVVRPIDLLKLVQVRPPSPSVSSVSSSASSYPPAAPRPLDILKGIKVRPSPATTPISSSSVPSKLRPVDILATVTTQAGLQLASSTPIQPGRSQLESLPDRPRLIAPLPRRARAKSPQLASLADNDDVAMHAPPRRNPDILDLTVEISKTRLADILELTDSSGDDESDVIMDMDSNDTPAPDVNVRPTDFVFNSNIPVNPRQTVRPWAGSLQPQDWIPSREELHAEQVAFDRSLPAEMLHSGYPLYVSRLYSVWLNFDTSIFFFSGHLIL